MQFDSLSDFIQMNGHGIYVWAVYLIGMMTLLLNVFRPKVLLKRFYAQQLRASQLKELNSGDQDA